MKILLLQPSDQLGDGITSAYEKHGRLKTVYDRRALKRFITLPPLGLMYLAAPLVKAGHNVRIIDGFTLQLTQDETVREVEAFEPDLIGITLYSPFLKQVYELSRKLKERLSVPIIVGGGHPTAMPKEVLQEFNEVDFVMKGWGEFSIADFCEHLEGRRNAREVAGLWYRNHGLISMNAEADLPSDDALILPPDRGALAEMYEHELYYNIMSSRRKMDVLMTSRNCPFGCKFCFVARKKFVAHKPERVLNEISDMVDRGIDAIEIMDDNFTLDRKRARRIFQGIVDAGFDLEFRLRGRVDVVDADLLELLKQANVRSINYGMESGSDAVLTLMDKSATAADAEKACRLTKDAGILCQSSWIVGYPGETADNRQETFDFIRKNKPNTFILYPVIPLPETRLYKQVKEMGRLSNEWSVHLPIPHIVHEELSHPELCKLVDEEQQRLLLEPGFILQTLSYWVRNPNSRLLAFGIEVVLRKLRSLGGQGRKETTAGTDAEEGLNVNMAPGRRADSSAARLVDEIAGRATRYASSLRAMLAT